MEASSPGSEGGWGRSYSTFPGQFVFVLFFHKVVDDLYGVHRWKFSSTPRCTLHEQGISFDVVINGHHRALVNGYINFGIIMCFFYHLSEDLAIKALHTAQNHLNKIIAIWCAWVVTRVRSEILHLNSRESTKWPLILV